MMGNILKGGNTYAKYTTQTSYEAGRYSVVEDLREQCQTELDFRTAAFN